MTRVQISAITANLSAMLAAIGVPVHGHTETVIEIIAAIIGAIGILWGLFGKSIAPKPDTAA